MINFKTMKKHLFGISLFVVIAFLWPSLSQAQGSWIQNVNSKKFLALPPQSADAGTQLVQTSNYNIVSSRWAFEAIGNGYYRIRNVFTGLYLAVEGGFKNNGAKVIVWRNVGQRDIYWKLIPQGNNIFKIQNGNSLQFLAVPGADRREGIPLIQWPDVNQPDILWRIESLSGC